MSQTFHCPNCHGPLAYDTSDTVVECPFCGSSVIVPESLRAGPMATTASPDQSSEQAEVLAQIMAQLQAGRKIEAIETIAIDGQGPSPGFIPIARLSATKTAKFWAILRVVF